MSEARTDTTQARPREESAQAAEAANGRHRGPAATEEAAATAGGRHRREKQTQSA